MINVKYQIEDNKYLSLEVSGHAEYDDIGKDLICASVSSIMFGLMNALDNIHEDVEIKQLTNEIKIFNHSDSDVVNNYFELVMIQIKTIEQSYKGFIKVERK